MPDQFDITWLEEEWVSTAAKYSADKNQIQEFLEEIKKAYSKEGRYYHGLQHIYSLLKLSEKYGPNLAQKHVIDFSIFYHDIVYDVLKSNNEDRSAQVAHSCLQLLNVPEVKIQLVVEFIESTKHHDPGKSLSSDLAFFLDFDMCILGANWEVYSEYLLHVRKEYNIYPDILYRAGRKKFLKKCLSVASIFHTEEFRQLYEVQARRNIKDELDTLK